MSTYPLIKDKLMTAPEAVSRFIRDGMQLALGGFTVTRNPLTIVREIIRQGRQGLRLVAHSQGQSLELLVGAGCVSRASLAYGGMGRFAPTCYRFKKAVTTGQILVEDYTNYHMTLRFLAGAMNMPFAATYSGLETDIVKQSRFGPDIRGRGKIPRYKLKVMPNPLDDENGNVVILPPLRPDVAMIHAQYVGEDGTVRIKGLTFADVEMVKAADVVIVTCEEIAPLEFIRADPDQNQVPFFLVDAIIEAPFGAHPTACHLFYDYDPDHLNMYKEAAKDDDRFKRYLEEWVYPFETQEAYLEKVGVRSLLKIQANPTVGYAPGLERR